MINNTKKISLLLPFPKLQKFKKRIAPIQLSLILIFLSHVALSQSKTDKANTLTDPRDGQTYPTITISQPILGYPDVIVTQTWMAANLNYEMPDSWCYEDNPKNCTQYGRLYTWEAAKKACPKGWRLPTDIEWQRLMHLYGKGGLTGDGYKQNYEQLVENGKSGFSARLGGKRNSDGEFDDLTSLGYFWSSTENDADDAWYYFFVSVSGEVFRNYLNKSSGLSCRCLKD